MPKIKIERSNIKVHGHNGYGRYDLIGKHNFIGLTERQAEHLIGRGVIDAYARYCEKNDVETLTEGIILEIKFEKYKRKDSK